MKFHGYAYDLETRRYLYTEVHDQRIDGDRWLGGTVAYVDAAGQLLGRKTLNFTAHPFVPAYRMEQLQGGYMEAVRHEDGGLELVRRARAGAPEETTRIALQAPMAADSGLHMLIRSVFPDLLAGRTVRFHIAVPGSLDSFRFRAVKVADTEFEGRPAVRFRLEPATLLRLLADPLELVYAPEQRKLVEYRGISNVHDPVTGRAYNVHIAYSSKRPSDAPELPPGY